MVCMYLEEGSWMEVKETTKVHMLFSQDKQSLWWRKECTAILANWKYFKECKALKECKKCIKSYYSRVEPGSVHLNTEIGLSMITYLPWSWYMDLIWPIWHMLCYAKSLQLCPTLCDPIDSSPQGYPVPGILQARTLEWVAMPTSWLLIVIELNELLYVKCLEQ